MKLLILLALLLPLATGAQVRKCTIEGKVVYSDSQCGQTGQSVNTDANSMDTSGLLEQAATREKQDAQAKAKETATNARPRGGAPGPCDHIKFAGAAPTKREAEQRVACMRKWAKEYRRP